LPVVRFNAPERLCIRLAVNLRPAACGIPVSIWRKIRRGVTKRSSNSFSAFCILHDTI
jgi:hypothetical protein